MAAGSRVSPPSPHLPRHVAIVMDGNGRWANRRMMPRLVGHKFGMDALERIVRAAADRHIEFLTVFAFSSENWRRPQDEVSGLMELLLFGLSKYLARLSAEGVRLRFIGDLSKVSPKVRAACTAAEERTAGNSRITLSVAFNYGGRWDVVQACGRAMADGVTAATLDEATLSRYMALSYAPDPDLFIRTGGEYRVSNFLLWQIAYTEMYYTDCLWPDFGTAELDAALAAFARRDRRFGNASDRVAGPAAARA